MFTKKTILNDIELKTFIDIGFGIKETPIPRTDGISEYEIAFYETNGNAGKTRSIRIEVLDEGLESERAFYKDKVLESTL